MQELAQKEGLLFPVYDTARAGPPHAPTFSSTVEVGGGTFQGQEAKTKKQAEMNAAKVAYNALVKRKEDIHSVSQLLVFLTINDFLFVGQGRITWNFISDEET